MLTPFNFRASKPIGHDLYANSALDITIVNYEFSRPVKTFIFTTDQNIYVNFDGHKADPPAVGNNAFGTIVIPIGTWTILDRSSKSISLRAVAATANVQIIGLW